MLRWSDGFKHENEQRYDVWAWLSHVRRCGMDRGHIWYRKVELSMHQAAKRVFQAALFIYVFVTHLERHFYSHYISSYPSLAAETFTGVRLYAVVVISAGSSLLSRGMPRFLELHHEKL